MKHVFAAAVCRIRLALVVALFGFAQPSLAHDPLRGDHDTHSHGVTRAQPNHVGPTRVRDWIVEFRKTGDDRFLEEAWASLEPGLDSPGTDEETLIAAAFVAQSRHQFDRALGLVDRALAGRPDNDEAWLLAASIHLVQGDLPAATRACARLRDVAALVIVTCKSRVAAAGDAYRDAYDVLTRLLALPVSHGLSDDVLAWSNSVAGDLAVAQGRPQEAVEHFRRSLSLAERTQVRAALVDVLLAEGRNRAASEASAGDADALALVVRRLIAERRLNGADHLEREVDRLDAEFSRWIAAGDYLHAREMTRFYLDVRHRPELARRLAQINLALQKEPEDARLAARAGSDHDFDGYIEQNQ